MLSVRYNGRLGNNLFQIAAAIGQAYTCNDSYCLPKWKYAEYFPGLRFAPEVKFNKFYQEPGYHYTPIPCNGDIELRGYFQSEKYFSHCEDKIRQVFTPSVYIQDWVSLNRPGGVTTGLHIRRTDYITMGHYYYNLTCDYYNQALDLIKDKGTVIVFSDDIQWCRDNIKADVYSNGNEIQDFFLLASSNNIIMANSSFSWWASYLGKTNTIAPRDWFKPVANLSTKDLYLSSWTLL